MQIETAILVGVLFSGAIYLMLQTSFVRILFGIMLLTHAANIVLLASSGNPDGKYAPVIGAKGPAGTVEMVDPLPQALTLTAIVIGFGVAAYLILLLYRVFLDKKTTNAAELYGSDDQTTAMPTKSVLKNTAEAKS